MVLVLAACSFVSGGIPLWMFDDAPGARPVGYRCRHSGLDGAREEGQFFTWTRDKFDAVI